MGKKTSWLSTVKKVFKPKDSSSPSNRRRDREAEAEEKETAAADIVSVEHFPAEASSEATNHDGGGGYWGADEDEDDAAERERERAIAEAKKAAAAAAEAAARVVRLGGYDRPSREARAAVVIQAFYRGYLARRALRALRALVKLQALVRGHHVRKRAHVTLRCMQSLVRVQALARAHRLQLASHRNLLFSPSPTTAPAYHDPCHLRHLERGAAPRDRLQDLYFMKGGDVGDEVDGGGHRLSEWDGRQQSSDSVTVNSQRKLGAAYDYAYQPPEHEKVQWGWNWLERWMGAQQWGVQHGAPPPQPVSSYVTATAMDGLSEKTVEMDTGRRSPVNPTHYSYHLRDEPAHPAAVPSYMAATQSARAKVRAHVPVAKPHEPKRNAATRRSRARSDNAADSSSSGGGTSTTINPAARSPSHMGVALGVQTRRHRAYSPDSSCGGHDVTPSSGGRGRLTAVND